jgi:multisubunit Na+/H+ antiporter MnhG subunit
MPAAAWMTLIVSAVIILITAVGLIRVIYHLAHVRQTLGSVIGGVTVIADRTSTVPARLTSVNDNLKPVRDFCETV